MSRISKTFSLYVMRHFMIWFGIVLFGLLLVLALGDLLELMRQSSAEKVGIGRIFGLVLLKLPTSAQKLLPFVILLATIMCLWRLTRSSELIAARSLGISAKQFMHPIVFLAIMIAVVKVTVVSPIAASTFKLASTREAEIFPFHHPTGQINANRLWLRESVVGEGNVTKATIIHAQSTSPDLSELKLVTVLQYDSEGSFISRLDAKRAVLGGGSWHFFEATRTLNGQIPVPTADFTLPTEFTPEKISLSLSIPETMSFWELPGFIALNHNAGFPALPQRLALQNEWATPLFYTAMILIGSLFSLRLPRRGKIGLMLGVGIAIGFVFYFVITLIQAFGLSGRIPVVLAVWSFPVAACIVALSSLLHFEDG
ncbi:MAG: LptF/LptG family permease [Alphaproteobacteria bacterium]|nr:LptF/LptG family permease [Alphaproteobacteria bacterium]